MPFRQAQWPVKIAQWPENIAQWPGKGRFIANEASKTPVKHLDRR